MADILIRGIEMPREGQMLYIDIYPDGKVAHDFDLSCKQIATAVPVPPYGRLIDADAIWVEIHKICDRRDAGIITDLTCVQQLLSAVRHAPTIISKSEEVDDGSVH